MILENVVSWVLWAPLCALLSLFSLYLWVRPQSVDPSVPGPKRVPLLGIGASLFESDLTDGVKYTWDRWPTLSLLLAKKFKFQTWGGPTVNIGFGGACFEVVSPACLEYILRDNFENYIKGKLSRSFKELMGEFSFNTDGDLWKFHRKVTVANLNRQTVQNAVSVLNGKLAQLEQVIDEKKGEIFDFQSMAYRLTTDVFIKIGFGLDLDGLRSDKYAPFSEALGELQDHLHERFNDFFWEVKQRFGIGKREQRVKVLTKVVDDFADDLIQKLKENQADSDGDTSSSNIVTRFIALRKKENLPPPTNLELRNLVVGFIFAGRESTSAAMTWALYEMTRNPDVATRIRQEVKEVCGKQSLTYDLVQNMPYLHYTVMESLRLHPPAPESFRFAVKDDVLPDGTKIPGGALVMFSINTINHSDAVWDKPEEFNPERFEGKEPSQFSFATFSGGPRTCPGKSLALAEIKLCLAFLLSRYEFENAKNHDGSYHWATVMAMDGGFFVHAKRLQQRTMSEACKNFC